MGLCELKGSIQEGSKVSGLGYRPMLSPVTNAEGREEESLWMGLHTTQHGYLCPRFGWGGLKDINYCV